MKGERMVYGQQEGGWKPGRVDGCMHDVVGGDGEGAGVVKER